MKAKPSHSGFTLLELITVIAIVVALTGIVVGLYGYVNKKAANSRASGEIAMLRAAAGSYQAEYGSFPQSEETDDLKPTEDFDPTKSKYVDANLHLYRELTGDREPREEPDYQYTTDGEKEADRFLHEYDIRILNVTRDPQTKEIKKVKYIQDPWGYPYGYSTHALGEELDYQKNLRAGKSEARKKGNDLGGFNTAEFDLWSTGGSKPTVEPTSGEPQKLEWAKWIKNW